MLRTGVQCVALLLSLIGVWLLLVGVHGAGLQALFIGVLVLLAVRFERWRARTRAPANTGDWHATGERFEEPGTGRLVEVEYNPHTGERRYKGAHDP
jgi:hypothetical protein